MLIYQFVGEVVTSRELSTVKITDSYLYPLHPIEKKYVTTQVTTNSRMLIKLNEPEEGRAWPALPKAFIGREKSRDARRV